MRLQNESENYGAKYVWQIRKNNYAKGEHFQSNNNNKYCLNTIK